MPLPLIVGIAIAIGSALFGAKKGYDAYCDNEKANDLNSQAQRVFDAAKRDLSSARESTSGTLADLGKTKLILWDNPMNRFLDLYGQIRNVQLTGEPLVEGLERTNITKEELLAMKDLSLKAHEVVIGGLSALGTGALVGVGSYGGAMMFAAASTGTAISTLSGIAATNATLAWFGGGSLAAGGLGMAGGMAVLGGLVAGPVLAVGGLVLAAKARENLAYARSNLAEARKAAGEMNNATSILNSIRSVARSFQGIINQVHSRMDKVLNELEQVIQIGGTDYRHYSEKQKHMVYLAVQFAQVMKILLETPILTKSGGLDPKHSKALAAGRELLGSTQ
ncbi:MAG: hypothetical protein AB1646_14450 [Thermodesulfobacteriota bacterium]